MKEILHYYGTIAMVCRWDQELFGYPFTTIHRCARMMRDANATSHGYIVNPLLAPLKIELYKILQANL